jgi:hypothetical protein
MKEKLQKILLILQSFFPRPLPVGKTDYDAFTARIIKLSGPLADTDSLVWTISNKVMQLDPLKSSVSDRHFVKGLRKAAANQIASYVVMEIKQKQQELVKKAQEDTIAAVAAIASVSNEKS